MIAVRHMYLFSPMIASRWPWPMNAVRRSCPSLRAAASRRSRFRDQGPRPPHGAAARAPATRGVPIS